ncbi:MAG: hypothetical protein R3B47_20805 [Bacteroidia bacterium]
MLLIPNRLLEAPFVNLVCHNQDCVILSKKISTNLYDRESYVVKHAISIVVKGRQHIRSEQGLNLNIEAGHVAFIPKGLYTVTDLIAEDGEFESWHIYLDTRYLSACATPTRILKRRIWKIVVPQPASAQRLFYIPDCPRASCWLLYFDGKI